LVSVDAVPPARVLAHHHHVLVHEALGDVGGRRLEVENRRARRGAVERNLRDVRGERLHARGAAGNGGDCAVFERGSRNGTSREGGSAREREEGQT
jgi:hypothetical protein